jgi:hypothetical protein
MLRSKSRYASRRYLRVMGQEPTPGDPDTTPVPPSNPATPENPVDPAQNPPETPPTDSSKPEVFDRAYVEKLRRESAGYRTQANDYKTELEARELADMTEIDRVKALNTKAETETIPELQKQNRTLQVQVAAAKLGIVDPEVASMLVNWDNVNGGSTVEAELLALIEARPYLKQATGAPVNPVVPPATPPAPTTPSSQTNPATPTAPGKRTFTKSELDKMSTAQAQELMPEITYALENGLVDYTR